MSIVAMVNEKLRERVQVWEAFEKLPNQFPSFFQRVLIACLEDSIEDYDLKEQTALIVFLNHCFNSMEVALVREQVRRLVSLTMWISLQQGRRDLEFKKYSRWKKLYKAFLKKDKPEDTETLELERNFLHRLMIKFMSILETITLHDYTFITPKSRPCKKPPSSYFPELRSLALANVASVNTRETLYKHFACLSQEKLRAMASYLHLVPPKERQQVENWYRLDLEFLQELLISRHERRASQLEELNKMPLYPTEDIIWNESIIPTEYFSGDGCLALPKLNLQFLTLHDYLLRNFNLFRLESTYEIRQNIEDAVVRLSPWRAEDGGVYFGG